MKTLNNNFSMYLRFLKSVTFENCNLFRTAGSSRVNVSENLITYEYYITFDNDLDS